MGLGVGSPPRVPCPCRPCHAVLRPMPMRPAHCPHAQAAACPTPHAHHCPAPQPQRVPSLPQAARGTGRMGPIWTPPRRGELQNVFFLKSLWPPSSQFLAPQAPCAQSAQSSARTPGHLWTRRRLLPLSPRARACIGAPTAKRPTFHQTRLASHGPRARRN